MILPIQFGDNYSFVELVIWDELLYSVASRAYTLN